MNAPDPELVEIYGTTKEAGAADVALAARIAAAILGLGLMESDREHVADQKEEAAQLNEIARYEEAKKMHAMISAMKMAKSAGVTMAHASMDKEAISRKKVVDTAHAALRRVGAKDIADVPRGHRLEKSMQRAYGKVDTASANPAFGDEATHWARTGREHPATKQNWLASALNMGKEGAASMNKAAFGAFLGKTLSAANTANKTGPSLGSLAMGGLKKVAPTAAVLGTGYAGYKGLSKLRDYGNTPKNTQQ